MAPSSALALVLPVFLDNLILWVTLHIVNYALSTFKGQVVSISDLVCILDRKQHRLVMREVNLGGKYMKRHAAWSAYSQRRCNAGRGTERLLRFRKMMRCTARYVFKPMATKGTLVPSKAAIPCLSFLCIVILTFETSKNSFDDHLAIFKQMSILHTP